jgi:hypothetical protein
VRADAQARVPIRAGHALASRAIIGRVFVDRDGNGRQGSGEEGAAGVPVVSADGEVSVTDAAGRFSLRDVRPGVHVLRVDARGLPPGLRPVGGADRGVVVRADGWTTPRVVMRVVPGATDAGAPPDSATAVRLCAVVGPPADLTPAAPAPRPLAAAPVAFPHLAPVRAAPPASEPDAPSRGAERAAAAPPAAGAPRQPAPRPPRRRKLVLAGTAAPPPGRAAVADAARERPRRRALPGRP